MDLSKREVRLRAQPQKTFRRETTMPRQATDLPGLEVNAPINRADMSGADELSRILGLASNVGQNIARDIQEGKDKENAAQGVLDFSAGNKDEGRFAKSFAYRNAWQKEGAKSLALTVSQEVTDAVNEALNDPENPPTPEDINELIEGIFVKHTHDERGQLLDFGTPEAKAILGNALAEVKATIMPQALKGIKEVMDGRLLATITNNRIYEHFRGAPIGTPVEVKVEDFNDERDPLAPLPDAPKSALRGGPLVEPIKGFSRLTPTSTIGAAREGGSSHNGEDFAVPMGTEVKAPMAGTVVAAFTNERGGNQVRVKMADGAIIGFAHLSKMNVKKGDTVRAGQIVALSGSTGHSTGPHVHMTLEKGGRKMSVREYFRTARAPGEAVAELGNEPELVTEAPSVAEVQRPPFDFEGLMRDLPPSVSRAKAKDYFLKALIAEAAKNDDPAILNGLEDSRRKEGTPSFDPEDIAKIVSARDQLAEKRRIKAERAEREMHAENEDRIFGAMLSDNPPSDDFIIRAGQQGLIDNRFAYSIVHSLEAERKSEERMARAEDREAERAASAEIDVDVGTIIAERHAGIGDTSVEHDRELFSSGRLGQGKAAITRFRQLRTAARTAEQARANDPAAVRFGKTIEVLFKPKSSRGSGGTAVERARGGGGASATDEAANYAAMVNAYNGFIRGGMNAGEAYLKVVTQYGPKNNPATRSAREAQLRVMQARRLREGR